MNKTDKPRLTSDPPFWSDDFDTDMLKVLPVAADDLAFLRSVTLCTHGHTTHGRLNHPSVWNQDYGSAAFFGLGDCDPHKPAGFWTNSPLVVCTGLEAFRDAWVHTYVMVVNNQIVWDANRQWSNFETIMWNVRGWPGRSDGDRVKATSRAMRSLNAAIAKLRVLVASDAGRLALNTSTDGTADA